MKYISKCRDVIFCVLCRDARFCVLVVARFCVLVVASISFNIFAKPIATDVNKVATDVNKVLASIDRTAKDKARDASRKPAATLDFFGITPDMKVLELIPGKGWYTNILLNYLDKGNLTVAVGTKRIAEVVAKNNWNVKILDTKSTFDSSKGRGNTTIDKLVLPKNKFNAALTFRNYHNFDKHTRDSINKAVFKSLKRKGIYAVVGHTARHNAPKTDETWRRTDPVLVIKEVQAAGFILADYSNIHYRPTDNLQFDSTHKSINRDSDRFTLKFIKP